MVSGFELLYSKNRSPIFRLDVKYRFLTAELRDKSFCAVLLQDEDHERETIASAGAKFGIVREFGGH